jgi:hypothetical protein
MQELKAMWLHHKTVNTMRTHEATWPHHMPIFLIKLKASSKTKTGVNCLVYCMHPFTKSLVQVFSKSLKMHQVVM